MSQLRLSTPSPTPKPTDAKDLRNGNLSAVLSVIAREFPVSQSRIVAATGLKKPTVASLVTELVSLGWVRVSGDLPSAGGRPSQLLSPNPDSGILLALRIGLEGVSVLVVDMALQELALTVSAVDISTMTAHDSVLHLADIIIHELSELSHPAGIRGISLALPGVVDLRGTSLYAPGLPWHGSDFADLLRNHLDGRVPPDIPIHIQNEANLATLAEQRWGQTLEEANFVYILGEAGVGGGIVIDGRLVRGYRGAAGEIGHMTVDVNGPPCSCGRFGCWALFISEDALVRRIGGKLQKGHPSSLVGGPLTSARIVDAAEAGDELAREELSRVRKYLVAGIANLAAVYDPETIVIAGFLQYAFKNDLERISRELGAWPMADQVYKNLQVTFSKFGREGSLWGGVAAIYAYLTEPVRLRA